MRPDRGWVVGCVLCTMLVLGLAACGRKGSDEQFKKVQLGMTEAEVVAILGPPDKAWTHPQFTNWRMLEWHQDSRVVLEDGKVRSVVLHEKTILDKPEG